MTCVGIRSDRRFVTGFCGALALTALAAMNGCNSGGLLPGVPAGNRPPIVQLTQPTTNITVDAGDDVTIAFEGEDGEDQSQITIFVDPDQFPENGNEITLRNDLFVGPGKGSGQIIWDTEGFAAATYTLFARITDNVNPPVLAAGLGTVQVVPMGTNPLSNPPEVQFTQPLSNLGVASGDSIQIGYIYRDADTPVRLTLLLDKDLDPTNDDVNNPGDPLNPASNIIILPTAARQAGDPILPPDVPGQPVAGTDSVQIRTNPRNLSATPGGAFSNEKLYIFQVDFSQIPIREDGAPYFLRATIDDNDNPPVHVYAVPSITITGLASGFVDVGNVGKTIAGAKFQGFSPNERLGTSLIDAGDSDLDTVGDFMIGGRYASPRNRALAGGAYLVRGRRKLPFPSDTNSNGLPDLPNPLGGDPVDFPQPPIFIAGDFNPAIGGLLGPYQPQFTGRFGGTISVNSIGSFLRGVTYGMPETRSQTPDLPPTTLRDPLIPNAYTAGLTSIARVDMTGDNVDDFVFGLPYVSHAADFHDDDPCDGDNGIYGDGFPNSDRCNNGAPVQNDNIVDSPFLQNVNDGMVILVSGANDVENDGSGNMPDGPDPTPDGQIFRLFVDAAMAGQFDIDNRFPFDDEGIILGFADTPIGVRMRGGWYGAAQDIDQTPPIVQDSEFGRTVARLPSYDNDRFDELLISSPGNESNRGRIDVQIGTNMNAPGFYAGTDTVRSLPHYACFDECVRGFIARPVTISIFGQASGDRFGNARSAGQFNQDGTTDILCGSPAANRDGLTDNGAVYVLFTPAGGFGETELENENVPRLEIHGSHDGDAFGEVQDTVGDLNGDGVDDIAIGSPSYDDTVFGLVDSGYVGVIFGNRPLTGENGFTPEQVATPVLSGVRFRGSASGVRAGAAVAGAGDFNQDGYDDLLITAPGETRVVNGQTRLGIAYLIFGGPHLTNQILSLSDVGSPALPGVVFASPYAAGSVDQAALDNVAGIGDVDADGFADIAISASMADFVNPASPNQRRIDAGEVWVVYGSNFGTNELPQNAGN